MPSETKQTKQTKQRVVKNKGIFLSIPRVKTYFSRYALNKKYMTALEELEHAEPHDIKTIVNKTVSVKRTQLIPLDKLSVTTTRLLSELTQLKEKEHQQEQASEKERHERLEKLKLENPKLYELQEEERKLKKLEHDKLEEERKLKKDDKKRKVKEPSPYAEQKNLIRSFCYRVSKDYSLVLTSLIDTVIHSCLMTGLKVAESQKLKRVQRSHLLENADYKLFYSNTPAFIEAEKEEAMAEALRKIQEEEKKKSKSGDVKTLKGAEDVEEVVKQSRKLGKFESNIVEMFKYICQEESGKKYKNYILSTQARIFLNSIVKDILVKYGRSVCLHLQSHKSNTVKGDHIRCLVRQELIFNNFDDKPFLNMMDERIKVYRELSAEKSKTKSEKQDEEVVEVHQEESEDESESGAEESESEPETESESEDEEDEPKKTKSRK